MRHMASSAPSRRNSVLAARTTICLSGSEIVWLILLTIVAGLIASWGSTTLLVASRDGIVKRVKEKAEALEGGGTHAGPRGMKAKGLH